jgi:hypothetical protein
MQANRLNFLATGLAAAGWLSLPPAIARDQMGKSKGTDSGSSPAGDSSKNRGPHLGDERTETYRIGVVFTAEKGPCTGLLATVPIPMDWPEQTVTVVSEEKSSHVKRLEYKVFDGGVKQLRATIPTLPAGAEAKALVTLRITRRVLTPPADPSQFSLPEKIDAKLRGYLGASPAIESADPKIQAAAKEAAADKTDAWERVAALYDWTRARVKYQEGPLKGALQALKDGTGDCEELTSLFVAMCRANKIPARIVWVPGHCYPEFYLVDRAGQGYWIPCQAAGDREFGGIGELRPILQKGDNFSLPEKPREKVRYASEFVSGRSGQPTVKFIREAVK